MPIDILGITIVIAQIAIILIDIIPENLIVGCKIIIDLCYIFFFNAGSNNDGCNEGYDSIYTFHLCIN
jgi:hypothetical protein